EVEGVTDLLQRGFDDIEAGVLDPGGEIVPIDAETITHRVDGHEVDIVEVGAGLNLIEAGQGPDGDLVDRGEPGRREVVEALRTVESEVEGERGGEGEHVIDVVFGDRIDGGGGSLLSHDDHPIAS